MTTIKKETVRGYVFIIETQSGRVFPYIPSFGVTVDDAIERMSAGIRRTQNPKSKRPIAIAACELTVVHARTLDDAQPWAVDALKGVHHA